MRAGEVVTAVGSARIDERERAAALRRLDREHADGHVPVDEYRMLRAAVRGARTRAELRDAAAAVEDAIAGAVQRTPSRSRRHLP